MPPIGTHTTDNYRELGRVWPIDAYEIPPALVAYATDLYLLRVPLLGQWNDTAPQDWCGRTSASMVHNFYARARGGSYVTHWRGPDGGYLDLRTADGKRAFHNHPDDRSFGNVEGYTVEAPLCAAGGPYKFEKGALLPRATDRLAAARRIREDPKALDGAFAGILAAVRANNPVVFYSGFSHSATPHHIVVIAGYARLPTARLGSELWLAIANAATFDAKLRGALGARPRQGRDDADWKHLGALSPEVSIINLVEGDWGATRASYDLVRASAFYAENPLGAVADDLFMDYWDKDVGGVTGEYFFRLAPTSVPDSLVVTRRRHVYLPLERDPDPLRPPAAYALNEAGVGGYYPLGSYQNLHSGVHFPSRAAGHGSPVRCLAPGRVAAIRMSTAASVGALGDGAESPPRADSMRALSTNHHGLVLVRHELEAVAPPAVAGDAATPPAPAQRFVFYSLYLHLRPPGAGDADDGYAGVGWINRIGRSRGAVIGLDPASVAAFARRRFLAARPAAFGAVTAGELRVFDDAALRVEAAPLRVVPRGDLAATAFVRAPEPALEKAREALEALGRVATFADPVVPVAAGEVLGYVDSFLHAEVLSPASSAQGLAALMAFATAKLGADAVPPGRVFREVTENNYCDDGELAALLQLLPTDDLDRAGGAPALLSDHYTPEMLHDRVRGAAPLAFAKGAFDPKRFSYRLAVELAPFTKDPLPAGRYRVRVYAEPSGELLDELDYGGGTTRVEVTVPASAERLRFEPVGFHLMEGAHGDPTLDLAQLSHLAGARLRDVLVENINEWSPAGLKLSLDARVASGHALGAASDTTTVASLVDETAWWGHRESPVPGASGRRLFGDELPAAGKLHHVHPVTLAWALQLLVSRGHLRFVEPKATSLPDARAITHLVVTPPLERRPPLRVGSSFVALALAAGDAGPDVTADFELRPAPGDALRLASGVAFYGGIARCAAALTAWGRSTVALAGGSPQAIGSLTLEAFAPRLAPAGPGGASLASGPVAAQGGPSVFTWRVELEAGLPHALEGWVAFRVWKGEAGATPPAALSAYTLCPEALPVVARAVDDDRIEAGFVVRAPAASGAPLLDGSRWAAGDFLRAPDGKKVKNLPPVSTHLVRALDRLRADARYGHPVQVYALSQDGRTATVVGKLRDALLEVAGRLRDENPSLIEAVAAGEKRDQVRITATPPPSPEVDPGAGALTLSFNAAEALGRLLARHPVGPTERLRVRLGVVFPSGGWGLAPALAGVNDAGVELAAMDWDALRTRAGDRVLEVWSSGVDATLARPSLGPVTCTVVGQQLLLRAELRGDHAIFWKSAAPTFVVNGRPLGRASPARGVLTAALDLLRPGKGEEHLLGKALTITARTTRSAYFGGALMPSLEAEAAATCDTTPTLALAVEATSAGRATVTVTATRCFGLRPKVTVRATPSGKVPTVALRLAPAPARDPFVVTWVGTLRLDARDYVVSVSLDGAPAGVTAHAEQPLTRPRDAAGPPTGGPHLPEPPTTEGR